MTTRIRLAMTLGFGVLFGAWMAFAQAHTGEDLIAVGALLLFLVAGALVRRWWVVLALLGPLAALAYLEISGYVGPQEEYADRPLLSPPGIVGLILLGGILLLGVGLGNLGEWLAGARKRRRGEVRPAGSRGS